MSLKLNNISKSFGEKNILSNFSYCFSDKGLYIIRGESGIGKTTLLRIISGLDEKYDGEVENGGIGNVSVMFQEYRLFPTLSALKNASIPNKDSDHTREAALLMRLGFLDADLKKKPHHLSGGMKQRVAFVRAVSMSSPILILDEPTKELDADTARIMAEIIAEEAKERLVIVVTHDELLNKLPYSDIINFRAVSQNQNT